MTMMTAKVVYLTLSNIKPVLLNGICQLYK